ncbi:unnamed protein product (macronuclear) [Paramecium tetraurelia]|uniref:Uncharacterized protein n=1 Tax=Paramecium tetraurelia TaxID=5888 RepID=A0CE35_PARTE|nr:uncharacterized protein GSPATT00007264001 [Paramecium tetraurelia]CAK69052.1 unnamed protein product [Paramecium tetraurelia]|eukprot:XP_001436449.1 hypothetical protein (macronuclear) [Paramecium tetraurelia strain d4-2]
MSQDQLILDDISDIMRSTRIIDKYLVKALHCIINDYQQNMDINALLDSLNNSKHLVCNKYCLLESKSNLLRYVVNTENYNNYIKIIAFLSSLIQQQELKSISQLKQTHKPNCILIQPKKTKNVQNDKSPKKCFDIKPKYFHSKSQTWIFNSKQYISKILDRELSKLQQLQTQHDDYSRYRSWSIQQQELQQENKQRFNYQQRSSRELRFSITTSTSPKQKSQILPQTNKEHDYSIQVKRLKNEISQLESKLKLYN